MSTLTLSRAWQALHVHRQAIAGTGIAQLFAADPQRCEAFALQLGELLLDYSKNLVTAETMTLLVALARERDVDGQTQRMFDGEKINTSENRAVLHTALRGERAVMVDGADVMPQVRATLGRMREFSNAVRAGGITGHGGRKFTDVINIGIGGSHLGPALATHALAPYANSALRVHFVSNVDGAALHRTLASLDAAATLVIVTSKTFTTQETLLNALSVRAWLADSLGSDAVIGAHLAAVTANTQLALEFGIAEARIFPFWDWVGGRYSLWSAVGLPLALAVGMDNFEELLGGARTMDEHFRTAPLERNMPVILALLGVWYNDFFGAASHAVLPYDESLALLPAYLQQLDMESSGKRVTRDGGPVDYDTGAVIWGAPGTDAQHSFFQLLHQGTRLIPADFIAACQPQPALGRHHEILMANFFAQTAALMNGAPSEGGTGAPLGNVTPEADATPALDSAAPDSRTFASRKREPCSLLAGAPATGAAQDAFPGNRPTNSILVEKLTPHALGMLLALYEHKVFVQNTIWGINAFDQPGVELGKRLANRILPELAGGEPVTAYDASTNALINFYKSHR